MFEEISILTIDYRASMRSIDLRWIWFFLISRLIFVRITSLTVLIYQSSYSVIVEDFSFNKIVVGLLVYDITAIIEFLFMSCHL